MSHSGPLTMAQKRMLAMRAETANAAQSPGSPHMPLLPAVYDDSLSTSTSPHLTAHKQPLVSFGDIEMHNVSASASNAASPPSTYVSTFALPEDTDSRSLLLTVSLAPPSNLLCCSKTVRASWRCSFRYCHHDCSADCSSQETSATPHDANAAQHCRTRRFCSYH